MVCRILHIADRAIDLTEWEALVERVEAATRPVRIGLIGKYVSLLDAYLSVVEACKHGGFHHGAKVEIDWIQAEEVEGMLAAGRLADLDGIVIPGGFGERGMEGKIAAAGYAREHDIPCLGLCLGLQAMTIEYARNVLGMTGANTTEIDARTQFPVIDLMDSQRGVTDLGGTMRLGAYVAELTPGSQVAKAYGRDVVSERHRHRYEFNPRFRTRFEESGLRLSGTSPDNRLVEFIELDGHPFWVGTQAHPELKSRPNRAAPLFREFVGAALERAEARAPAPLPAARPGGRQTVLTAFRHVSDRELIAAPPHPGGEGHLRGARRVHLRARRDPRHGLRRRGAAARRRPDGDAGPPVPRPDRPGAAGDPGRPARPARRGAPRRPPTASSRRRSAAGPGASSCSPTCTRPPGISDEEGWIYLATDLTEVPQDAAGSRGGGHDDRDPRPGTTCRR